MKQAFKVLLASLLSTQMPATASTSQIFKIECSVIIDSDYKLVDNWQNKKAGGTEIVSVMAFDHKNFSVTFPDGSFFQNVRVSEARIENAILTDFSYNDRVIKVDYRRGFGEKEYRAVLIIDRERGSIFERIESSTFKSVTKGTCKKLGTRF